MLGQAEEGTYNLREDPEDSLVLCATHQLSLPMRQDKDPTDNSPPPSMLWQQLSPNHGTEDIDSVAGYTAWDR